MRAIARPLFAAFLATLGLAIALGLRPIPVDRIVVAYVLVIAALGGFFLASYHARKVVAPRAVVFVHAGAAVIGFLLLAGGAFNLI